jgi:hypothetical protein
VENHHHHNNSSLINNNVPIDNNTTNNNTNQSSIILSSSFNTSYAETVEFIQTRFQNVRTEQFRLLSSIQTMIQNEVKLVNQTWPFVTITSFEARMTQLRQVSSSSSSSNGTGRMFYFGLYPFINDNSMRTPYEAYTAVMGPSIV